MSNEGIPPVETEVTPAQEVYSKICTTYPFFDTAEKQRFTDRITAIHTKDPVEQVRRLIEALDNPHASFYRKQNIAGSKEKAQLKAPTVEVLDNVMVLHVPELYKDNVPLTELFRQHEKETCGLIVDVRECGGGVEMVGKALIEILAEKGTYEYGTNYRLNDKGALVSGPCQFRTTNETPYNKPILVLISSKTFSSGERFTALLRASTKAVVIDTPTYGGSGNPTKSEVTINGDVYEYKIPTWRYVLPGETRPIEETSISPDITYSGNDIIEFAIRLIKAKNQQTTEKTE